jgi:transcriptional regulator with XRE-family HTH domain
MATRIVDGRFGVELRRLREATGLSLRRVAAMALSSRGHLGDLETGRRQPTEDLAARLDEVLGTGGVLSAMIQAPPTAHDPERLDHAARHPRRVDPATVDSLADLLDTYRRLEDSIGAAPLLPAVRAQLDLVSALAAGAAPALRPAVVELAAQWAQFGGWLNAAVDRRRLASRWYSTALEWGTEAGNADMIATVLSMRGHLAWSERRPRPMIELSAAALREPASAGVRAIAAQQQARGHALVGQADATVDLLDRAVDLLHAAREQPDREPAWLYFHSPAYLAMQRGLSYRLLGENELAIEDLRNGLAGLAAGSTGAAWTGPYLVHLGAALASIGEAGEALTTYERVRTIGAATRTRSLVDQAEDGARAVSAGI